MTTKDTQIDVDIAGLAKLARLAVTDAEMEKLRTEIPDILGFVTTIQEASVAAPQANTDVRNIMRDDVNPRVGGEYTADILNAAPAREGDRIAVSRVISK